MLLSVLLPRPDPLDFHLSQAYLPRGDVTHSGLSPPSHVNYESRHASYTCHRSIWWRWFLDWGSRFLGVSSLCHVDRTNLDSHSRILLKIYCMKLSFNSELGTQGKEVMFRDYISVITKEEIATRNTMPRCVNHSIDGSGRSEIHARLSREGLRDGSVIRALAALQRTQVWFPTPVAAHNHLYFQFEGPNASGLHRHLHFQEDSHVQPHLPKHS